MIFQRGCLTLRAGLRLTTVLEKFSWFCRRVSTEDMRRAQIKKVLCVAEKNDAAKGIAEIMSNGGMRRKEGLSRFNKIYEYEYHWFGQNVTVSMTSVSGHLLGLEFKAPFQKWHSCNPVVLFDAEVEKYCPDNYVDIKRTLEREVRQCQALVIWTDCDREGENIGFEVIEVCKAVKQNLQVFRARFSEITPNSIRNACQNLAEPDQNVSDAVDVRQELDLRIGASFTRFQTLRLQKIFPTVLSDQLISYGSCQFPTLGFVVERFKAIQAFIPETFYKIKVTHEMEDCEVDFGWKRNRLFHHTACLVLYQMCMENPVATVIDVSSKPKSKWRPLPLDTVELEKLASRKLKISAKETMKIAEKLYTQGFISYPRTETNIFPKDLNLTPLVEQQTQDAHWGSFAQGILERGGPTPRNGTKTDQAHPPIHPTKYTSGLQGNEQRLYEFIVRHFLACCSQDAQGQETTVDIDIAQERFATHGLMIIARNYLDVYPYDKWYAKVIPVYERGSQFQPTTIEMLDGETSPPQLLTEADLISLMEKHGIGTDATHADHIETIKSRMYVGLTPDQRFLPGELGMGLVEGYDSMGYEMSKPDLRAELEADLKLICEGRKDKFTVLRQQIQNYKQVFIEAVRKAKKLDQALSSYFGEAREFTQQEEIQMEIPLPIRKCPQCSRDMALKRKKDGKGFFLSCMGYPGCKAAVWFPESVLEVSRDESVCPTCRPHPVQRLKFKFKRGSLPPAMPLEFVSCIGGCDEMLREILDLKYLRGGGGGGGTPQTNPPSGSYLRNNQSHNQPGRPDNSCGRQPPRSKLEPKRPAAVVSAPRPVQAAQGPAGENAVVCNCGQDAIILTVRKEGPNQGRQFYKCNTGNCSFFLWADQQPEEGHGSAGGRGFSNPPRSAARPSSGFGGSAGPSSSVTGRPGGNSRFSGGGGGDAAVCSCNEPAVTRTVMKDGPNRGRSFHTCPKPREQQCGFFQWADENVPPVGPGGGFDSAPQVGGQKGKRQGGNAPTKGPASKRQMTCGVCHQPGHNRTTCPQNN
ncbi:DNA topoisomerase 3-alpha isoform X1 [Acipenser ruthenus]|uniref:DNA topoisomerase 3-alpha isoform X1 n=1 Tax=Acipenser ruthenus TaxID=7906 RepID=UPI0027420A3E|nr:DNA topoisomerase 3-alpha isoform X1 [Acipenser ruthenus]